MAKDSIKIDFGKEEEGGGRVRWKKGNYHVKIVKLKKGRSEDKDTPYVAVTFKVLEGPKKGKTITERLYLTPKSLKRIRLLLEACGMKVPKKAVNLKFEKLLSKKLWIEIEDDDSGKDKGYGVKSTVSFEGFMSEEDYEESDEDEEDEDDDDEDDDEGEDDEDDEDEDEDEDEDDDDEDEEDDDDEDEDDDDDEDEEPVKKSKKKSKTKKKPAAKAKSKKKGKKSKKSDEDLEELDLDEL